MSTYKISSSSELMQNYLQAEAIGPQEKFQALQTNAGTSLLFSIGSTDPTKVFYVFKEVPKDKYGWSRSDISSAQIKKDFPSGATCVNFAAAQTIHGSPASVIHLAMVVNDGVNDHLYLSLNNSDEDTSWTDGPAWVQCPFNAKDIAGNNIPAPAPFKVVDVFISEATDKEYIVADIVGNPGSSVEIVSRYFIDTANPAAPLWRPHDLPFELETKNYSSCLGRPAPKTREQRKHPIDGLYTTGTIDGSSQFVYRPLYSIFDRTQAPSPTPLQLTQDGNLVPDAIAACRNPDNTSDLYAMAGGALYYFASNNQCRGAIAVPLSKNRFFTGVKSLFASVTEAIVTLWGLNASDEIFYTTCPVGELQTASCWSVPLPIMRPADKVSPYVNRVNNAQTFFAHIGANQLKKAVKSPGKNGTWNLTDIHLPPLETKHPAKAFSSYTTHLRVTGPDSAPVTNKQARIKATNVTSVYINHLYYVVGPAPIFVDLDQAGSVTLVEAVSRLDSTQFDVSVADQSPTHINPHEQSPNVKKKMRSLNSSNLRTQVILSQDGNPRKTRRLVLTNASDADVKAAGDNLVNLWQAYDHVHSGKTANFAAFSSSATAARLQTRQAFMGTDTSVEVDMGDLLSMLESRNAQAARAQAQGDVLRAGESWWEIFVDWIEDAGRKIWHFIVKTVEGIFHFIIETIEQVFAAFKYVFNKIVQTIEDVVDFVEFLFELDDIRRTKDVTKNLFLLLLEAQIEEIKGIKDDVDKKITELLCLIDTWAGLDWATQLGNDGKETPQSMMAPLPEPSATESFFGYHFQTNVDDGAPAGSDNFPVLPSTPFDDLWAKVKKVTDTMVGVKDQVEKLALEAPTIPLAEFFKRLVGIVAHAGLEFAQIAIDALLDILYESAKAGLKMLDTPIYIPVITDILEVFGVPDFSMLDALCWVGAVPTTAVYKAAIGIAPFPDDAETTFLIEAKSFKDVLSHFSSDQADSLAAADRSPSALTASFTGSNLDKNKATPFLVCHGLASAFGLFYMVVGPIDAATPDTGVEFGTGAGSSLLSLGIAVSQFTGSFFFPYPSHGISNETVYNRAIAGIRFGSMLAFNPVWGLFMNNDKVLKTGYRKIGAALDGILACFAAIGTADNMINLVKSPESPAKSLALTEESSNCLAYFGRCSRTFAVMIPEETTKGVLAVGMGICFFGYSLAQFAECSEVSIALSQQAIDAVIQ